jgi:hypothetical protein
MQIGEIFEEYLQKAETEQGALKNFSLIPFPPFESIFVFPPPKLISSRKFSPFPRK